MGLIEDDVLLEEANNLAQKLSKGPKFALGLMKKFVNRSVCDNLDELLELEALGQSLCFESAEFKEGVNAFFEKRKPVFNQ